MANFWMHNGFLQVEGEKMSKSLGNFVTIRDLLKDWPGDVLRFQTMMTHYRQPINWTKTQTQSAAVALDSFRHFTTMADVSDGRVSLAVQEALAEDLNTPEALAELFKLADEARIGNWQAASDLSATCRFLGIELKNVSLQTILRQQHDDINDSKIEAMIADRAAARAKKNFKESDRIRDELAKMGVVLKDTKDGTTWEIAR
jgi:cysteinyl-tRNA synthetase